MPDIKPVNPVSSVSVPPTPVPTPAPAPVPTPEPSFLQLIKLLGRKIWTGITGAGKKIPTGTGIGHKLLVLFLFIVLAFLAGFAGGLATKIDFPSWHIPLPIPHPEPAPISAPGLHVLVVGDEAKMSPQQINALKSTEVRTYLNATCPKGPDGTTPEYRIWPSTVDTSNESQLWKDAFQRTSGKTLPWLIISNPGKGGYEGPLPADQISLLKLLRKYG